MPLKTFSRASMIIMVPASMETILSNRITELSRLTMGLR